MQQYRIEGMDCASCVSKIETALARKPGVSDVQVNFASQTLQLTLATDTPTTSRDIEQTIKSLGFGVETTTQATNTVAKDTLKRQHGNRWWQSRKGRLVIGLGLLFTIAYIFALLLPDNGRWLFALAVIVSIVPFARRALALAKSGTVFSIEMLMSVAALGALFIGEPAEAAVVILLFAVGELFESMAADSARAGIRALTALMPKTAILLDEHGNQRNVGVSALQVNDTVLVRAGDRVPADGIIIKGTSSLDDSPVTGESVPVAKSCGDNVFAGSINIDGVIQVRVAKTAADNTIARIITMVEQAQASKAPTARFIERFSHYYTPLVIGIAAVIVVLPTLMLQAEWHTWLYRGLALLLIACPCALVLSTPAAIASALAVGARRGLLIKGGRALETIAQVDTIAFDKTGTLTTGKPIVTDIITFTVNDIGTTTNPDTDKENIHHLLTLLAGVSANSTHPLAQAIIEHAQDASIDIPLADDVISMSGKAVSATIAGKPLVLASPIYAAQHITISPTQLAQIETLQRDGKTVSVLFDQQQRTPLGLVALRDELRDDAQAAITKLNAMGVHCLMLSGDNSLTAQAIASNLAIDWVAELLPTDKLQRLEALKNHHTIAMVGDGINDAPALATADVGIAMGGGTDVAIETADIALLKNRVFNVAQLVSLARATMANIRQNVFFALGLKGVFLITTILGLTGLWIAVLTDVGATVLVTLNALRLLRFKDNR